MVKKVLFLGLSILCTLSGFVCLVKTDSPKDEETKVLLPIPSDDDDDKDIIDTEDGVMYLSLDKLNLK